MKRCFYTVVDKQNEQKFLPGLSKSLEKFTDIPLVVYGEDVIKQYEDPMFFYRATPILAMHLFSQGYDEVCKIDADSIVTGNLDSIWEGEYDVATVLNTNPREMKKLVVTVASVDPLQYMNCGFVVIKNKQFAQKWLNLCHSYHFDRYQYKEQDLLNLMIQFGDYKVKQLDGESGFYGLSAKGYYPMSILKDEKIIIPANKEWNTKDTEVKVVHFAGGNDANKGNYKLLFPDGVIERLDFLTK